MSETMDSSLNDLVDLTGHLQFIEELLERHELDPKRKASWKLSLDAIRIRQADTDLYLAVVGEFSSGKSTLINALIRLSLLPTDVLPATTSTAIVLRYDPTPHLRVEYTDGRSEEYRESPEFEDLIRRFTAVEEIARTVSQVTVHFPAPVLRQGLVAIDMPGSNVENPRHVELAGWAIRKLCDVAIVAIPANIPVSETLVAFLRKHLGDVLHRCVFVATKIDLLHTAERPKVLATIAGRLTGKLGIAQPPVLPASAAAALGEPLPDGTDADSVGLAGTDYRALQTGFLETEETIARTLQDQRILILLERLSTLLSTLFDCMKVDLEAMERRYIADHETLETHRVRDLKPYIEESKACHGSALDAHLAPLVLKGRTIVAKHRAQVLGRIQKEINGAGDEAALRTAANEGLKRALEEESRELKPNLEEILAEMAVGTREEVGKFEKQFMEIYRSLAALEGNIHLGKKILTQDISSISPKDLSSAVEQALVVINNNMRKSNLTMKASALTGAALGSAVAPGIGTVLGLLAGFIAGAALSPPLEEMRRTCWEGLRPHVEHGFSDLETKVQRYLTKTSTDAHLQLDQAINGYFDSYDTLVQRMIVQDRSRAESLARCRRCVLGDLADLDQRRQDLAQARAGLQKMKTL